jgi:uncharacterized paraquat-inducible protein A
MSAKAIVECPACDAELAVWDHGLDQSADCPECEARLTVTYDASFDGLWRGRHYVRVMSR